MRFTEFLRVTVLSCGGGATLLAAVTVIGLATGVGNGLAVPVAAGWWVLAAVVGLWLGRRADASPPIASLLSDARTARTLPEIDPARTLVNRLWPLLVCCVGAAAAGIALPQVPAIAAGFVAVWALSWRRQASAVTAIEGRDGVRFYVERTSPLSPIRLVRSPGFRSFAPDGTVPRTVEPVTRQSLS